LPVCLIGGITPLKPIEQYQQKPKPKQILKHVGHLLIIIPCHPKTPTDKPTKA